LSSVEEKPFLKQKKSPMQVSRISISKGFATEQISEMNKRKVTCSFRFHILENRCDGVHNMAICMEDKVLAIIGGVLCSV
jgi:hypothetical protein